MSGLVNIGNTCYMNSILQCLFYTPLIRNYFISHYHKTLKYNILNKIKDSDNKKYEYKKYYVTSLSYQLNYLFKKMLVEEEVKPEYFKKILGFKDSKYAGYDQNDSHEVLLCILDNLHEELKVDIEQNITDLRNKDDVYEEIMNGDYSKNIKNKVTTKYMSYIKSHYNSYERMKYDKILTKPSSVISDNIFGINKFVTICGNCKNKHVKYEHFMTLSVPIQRTITECLDKYYEIEIISDYKCDYCDKKSDCTRTSEMIKEPNILIIHINRFSFDKNARKNTDIVNAKDFNNYELIGISCHHGAYGGGHYVSYNKDNNWYKCDDHFVAEVDSPLINSAYVLFYKKNE